MGGCVSLQNRSHKLTEKNQSSKSRKGRGKTVSPVPGATITNIKKEQTNGVRYSSAETAISNLVHLGSDVSITAYEEPEHANSNFHATEVQRRQSISYGGSKEDAYFDSVAFLDSDCEEDFVSVNGDFLPSAGNSLNLPNDQGTPRPSVASLKDRMIPAGNTTSLESGGQGTPRASVASLKDKIIPVEKKKKLKEFFMEKLSSEDVTAGVDNVTFLESQAKGVAGPEDDGIRASDVKYEVTNHRGGSPDVLKDAVVNNMEDNSQDMHEKQITKCCLPRLASNGRANEKKGPPHLNNISKENKQR